MNAKSKPPALNVNFMSKGRPEEVSQDIMTDLPYDTLIHNEVYIGMEKPPTNEFLMDSLITDYKIK